MKPNLQFPTLSPGAPRRVTPAKAKMSGNLIWIAPDSAASVGSCGSPGGVIATAGGSLDRQVIKPTSSGVTFAITSLRTLRGPRFEYALPGTSSSEADCGRHRPLTVDA